MTDVFTLFTTPLPSNSNAFSNYRSPGAVDRSDSPPRKTPRLSNDSDSASASRSRQTRSYTGNDNEGGPVTLRIIGVLSESHLCWLLPWLSYSITLPSCSQGERRTYIRPRLCTCQAKSSSRITKRKQGPFPCLLWEDLRSLSLCCLVCEQRGRCLWELQARARAMYRWT